MMALRAVVPIAFLVGIYRLQTSRHLAAFLVELNRGVPVGHLEGVMARSLGDPTLRLVFPQPGGVYVDAAGAMIEMPVRGTSMGMTAIRDDRGTEIAVLIHDPALDEDPDLLQAAGTAARLSLENERLQAEVRAQLAEVRASRKRLVEASDAERRRVERDLHDGAQQRLVTLALQLQHARNRAAQPDADLTALLADASAELDLALGELRELARGIHPAVLSRAGLQPAVTTLVERCPIPVSVAVPGGRCSAAVESTAYFIVAEALTNVIRYSSASNARVVASRTDGVLVLEVSDDGIGGADPGAGTGLRGLQDRVAAVGGQFALDSPVGVGTTVRAILPCD
jgi:signal transduction histidine kinase